MSAHLRSSVIAGLQEFKKTLDPDGSIAKGLRRPNTPSVCSPCPTPWQPAKDRKEEWRVKLSVAQAELTGGGA